MKKLDFRRRVTLLLFCFGFAAGLTFLVERISKWRVESVASRHLFIISELLGEFFQSSEALAATFQQLVSSNSDLDPSRSPQYKQLFEEKFNTLVQNVEPFKNPGVVSVDLAPAGLLQFVSDPGRSQLKELDLLVDETQRKKVFEAIESRNLFAIDTWNNAESKPLLVLSQAIFSDYSDFNSDYWQQKGRICADCDWAGKIPDNFWGILNIVVNPAPLIERYKGNLAESQFSFSLGMVGDVSLEKAWLFGEGEDSAHPDAQLEAQFHGSKFLLNASLENSNSFYISAATMVIGFCLALGMVNYYRLVKISNKNATLADETVRANRAKTEFLATMSHELRTPIHSIMVYAESLTENIYGPISDPQRKVVGYLQKASEYLLDLVNDILDVNKIELNQLQLNKSLNSINHICNEGIGIIQNQLTEKNLNLEYNNDPRIPDFQFDGRRIKQVIINLLQNAIKFTPQYGHLSLETELVTNENHTKTCRINVRDSGIGISDEDQKTLFEPFKRVSNSLNKKHNGAGLGLYISKSIVELHQGTIAVVSSHGQGSSFIIDLPVSNVPEVDSSEFHI